MTRQDYQYNHKIERQKRIDSFPSMAKVMLGASILIGLLTALVLFIGTVRATEEIVRQLNF